MKNKEKDYEKINEVQSLNKNACLQCGACVSACPMGAISFNEDGFPIVNKEMCIKCKTCVNICPVEAIKISD